LLREDFGEAHLTPDVFSQTPGEKRWWNKNSPLN